MCHPLQGGRLEVHWIIPAIAVAAAGAFATAVLLQYGQRRKPYQLAWGIALSMFAVASLALTLGVAAGWSPSNFKLYYLFGAILNVPWLALGTVLLLGRPATARVYLGCLLAFSLASVALVVLAPVTSADLAGGLVPEGRRFLPLAVRVLAVTGNVVGTLVVIGGAVVSGLALRRRRELRARFEGNLLIALGVAFAAGGGVFAFLDQSGKLGAGLAVGACVMYLGFWRASAPVRSPLATGRGSARTGSAAP
jgi:hypothetical protein